MKTRVKIYSILVMLVLSTILFCGFKSSHHSFNSETKCTWCNGSGYCSSCEGAGKVDCRECNGIGEITQTYGCPRDPQTGEFICPTKKCTSCKGKGRVSCSSCNGTGRCKSCHGTGKY